MKHTLRARTLSAAVAVAGLAAATLAVSAQTPPPAPMMPGPMMGGMPQPAGEGDFVRLLDAANTSELEEAKYVVNRTKNPAVHDFAQRMIDDHSTAAVKLSAVTRGTNLRPAPRDRPTAPMGTMGVMRLQSLSGKDLDNTYMRMEVPAHRYTLSLLAYETKNGQNAGLKSFASDLQPTVAQHLQIAQAYLAANNLTPYSPPAVLPVPGNPNPNGGPGSMGPGTVNNPASGSNGGSTSGQGNGTGGTVGNPVVAPTYGPMGSGTPPANANGGGSTPAPMMSPTPRP